MTIAEIPTSKGYRDSSGTSCSQAELPVEGGEHQPTYKTFNLKSVLPTRMEQKLKEQLTNECPNLRPMPWERANP